jgi:hypothetical protein
MRSKSDEINVAQAQKFAGLLSDPLNPKIGLFFLAIVPPALGWLTALVWAASRAGPLDPRSTRTPSYRSPGRRRAYRARLGGHGGDAVRVTDN